MHRPICPQITTTPAEARAGRAPRPLPPDLLREAAQRLGIMSLLGAVLWFSGTAFYHLSLRAVGDDSWRGLARPDAVAAASILISLAVFGFTRRPRAEPGVMLNLGMTYLVVTALGISLTWHWGDAFHTNQITPMISWVGVVVLIFAAMIPNTPGKTLGVGLLAVSMNPVGMLIARSTGSWDFGPAGRVILMHYPDFMLVGVAMVVSHVVTRLGQQVSRARELGSYQLGERLGIGGMGEVYHATHRMLARPAAIKLIRRDLISGPNADAAVVAETRFRREAEAAARLQSPHTVALYDFGVTEDHTPYLVMELLDGMDLEHLVEAYGPLPANRAIHVLRQACASLEEAHAKGLVHRDIKPSNLHVGRLGLVSDFVKVLDFGLVKSITDGDGGRPPTRFTAENVHPGTPDFMAPEMARGEAVDGRADLYALGCVAYFMLTGHPVFEGANVFHIIARHLNEEPAAPSRHAPGPLPAGLDDVVLACLRKDPAGRPASAAALANMLEALPVEPWTQADAAAWWKAARPG